MPDQTIDVGFWSLLPALVTIGLALLTRQVIASLLAGILAGSCVVAASQGGLLDPGAWTEANPISRYLIPAIGSSKFAKILLIYLWCLGGLLGLWQRTGGARYFAESVGDHLVRGRRSSLFFAWLLGLIFHQGGTPSTVLAATTAKPVADKHRASHEELAYVVDSTASPVATLLPFNAWPAFVAATVAGSIPALLPDEVAGQTLFFAAIKYNFYALFAVLGTLLVSLGLLPWMGGALRKARDRAIETGQLDREGAQPMIPERVDEMERDPDYTPHLIDFVAPLGTLLGIAIGSYILTGSSWVDEAFSSALLVAMAVAWARGMTLPTIISAFVSGCQKMTVGALVLGLAVTIGEVSKDLGTGLFVVEQLGDRVSPLTLPAILTVLCMTIAFATGTSWGTYGVVFPLAMPLAWAVAPDPTFIEICFGAVLGGAVFGDQCSPISDTTILSSMFTGCDLVDHVRTQLPLALTAAGLGAAASTLSVLALV
jgi:Na+/H+ antiporter NhaC